MLRGDGVVDDEQKDNNNDGAELFYTILFDC